MSRWVSILSIILVLLFSPDVASGRSVDQILLKLDEALRSTQINRPTRDIQDDSLIWQAYEFDTGAGNREEVLLTNITVHENLNLPEDDVKWHFFQANDFHYLAGLRKSNLDLYKFNSTNAFISNLHLWKIDGQVFAFNIVNFRKRKPGNTCEYVNDILVIVCIETDRRVTLDWYRLSQEKLEHFWSWPVQKYVKDIDYIYHDNQHKILLLDNDNVYYGHQYSPIHVYGFDIDFSTGLFDYWLCQTLMVPKALDVQICPIRETTMLALQGLDNVVLYEYKGDESMMCNLFQQFQEVKAGGLKNFICFDSGYIQYLAVSGPQAGLYTLFEDDFQYNTDSEHFFNEVAEISWMINIPLDTYREESLLLVQLNNATIIALAWHGGTFKKIELPNNSLNQFDLSKITVIPKFGFVSGNKFVKIDVSVKELDRPIHKEIEGLIETKTLLKEVFLHQEKLLNETKDLMHRAHKMNFTINELANISTITATNVTLTDTVIYRTVMVGSANYSIKDIKSDASVCKELLTNFEKKLDDIEANLKEALPINSTELNWNEDLKIFGNLNISGTLHVNNFTINVLNGRTMNDIVKNLIHENDEEVIQGTKLFPSSKAEKLLVFNVNGIPLENIYFMQTRYNYSRMDFSNIKKMEIDGQLNFTTLNGINWEGLMERIVRKDQEEIIPGTTIIEGGIIANEVNLFENLNGLSYPEEYVLTDGTESVNISGTKIFEKLSVGEVISVNTINSIDSKDFILLNKPVVLDKEITFENLTILGILHTDGIVEGINDTYHPLLNESTEILDDVLITNLTVLGDVILRNSTNGKSWADFDDILLRTDENVTITGKKTFLREVVLGQGTIIKSNLINDHPIHEFVTTDTDQELPNLETISADLTFGELHLGVVKKLEELIEKHSIRNGSTSCLDRMILFEVSPIIDDLSFGVINANVTFEEFSEKLNQTFEQIHFKNLSVDTLIAKNISAKFLNGLDLYDYMNRTVTLSTPQNLTGRYVIDHLEAETLEAETINGMSMLELNSLIKHIQGLYNSIINGNLTLKSLNVVGPIMASKINGKMLDELYKMDEITMIFEKDVTIQNLTLQGTINNLNVSEFFEFISDAVLKSDEDIVVTGYKRFEIMNCKYLNVSYLNGHLLDNLLDPNRQQVLKGPIVIDGSVNVSRNFQSKGKIGEIPFDDLTSRFKYLGNGSYELRGDFRLVENATIENLRVEGTIQERNFDEFLDNVIYKYEENVNITGTKTLNGSVNFMKPLVIAESLNDMDLKQFYGKAVFINKPFFVASKIDFEDGIEVMKDLLVTNDLQSNSIMGIDINELLENKIPINKPTYILGSVTFTNVTFNSNINVEKLNEIPMDLLIPLRTAGPITVNLLRGMNITVKKIEMQGKINGHLLDEIYADTFMMFGDQNVTGNIKFHGDVYTRHDFNPRILNGINPHDIVFLNSNKTITANLEFTQPLVLRDNLRILHYVNGIDLNRWQQLAVYTNSPNKQIVTGKWTVHGNVYFEKNVQGIELLNGVNVTQLSQHFEEKNYEIETIAEGSRMDTESLCQDVQRLKYVAENQVYKFNTFDYLQVIQFDQNIVSVHYFEMDDSDFLLINFESCYTNAFMYTGGTFNLVVSVEKFGIVHDWITLQYENILYFLTVGKPSCGRNAGNLWKLENDEFTFVIDLGNVTDAKKVNNHTFITLVGNTVEENSIGQIIEKSSETIVDAKESNVTLVDSLSTNNHFSMCVYDRQLSTNQSWPSYFQCKETLSFKTGIFKTNMFLYYSPEISDNYIFICNNDTSTKKVVQTIPARKPDYFTILNFEGGVETLLIFVDNDRKLQIYEYRGVEGFVYRNTIQMKIDQLYNFKIRKYTNMARRHCLAIVRKSRLTILEAKMYGEKLDMPDLTCSMN